MQLITTFSLTSLLRFIVIFGLWCRAKGMLKLPSNVSVPAVLAFGDSIVDSGNNNNIKTLVKCNFPPYGKDFQGGKPSGRFCNGKIPSDMIGLFYLFYVVLSSLHLSDFRFFYYSKSLILYILIPVPCSCSKQNKILIYYCQAEIGITCDKSQYKLTR